MKGLLFALLGAICIMLVLTVSPEQPPGEEKAGTELLAHAQAQEIAFVSFEVNALPVFVVDAFPDATLKIYAAEKKGDKELKGHCKEPRKKWVRC